MTVRGPNHTSDTCADRDQHVVYQKRFDEGGAYAPFRCANLIVPVDIRQDDGELVSSDTGDFILPASAHDQTSGRLAEQLVAGLVTVDVVDSLEVVEVDEQEPDLVLSRARAG